MSLFRSLAPATFKDDGQKDLADFVSIMVSTSFKLANFRLCISLPFSASLGKSSVGPLRPKARVLVLIGVLLSLAGGEIGEIRDLSCNGTPFCEFLAIPSVGMLYIVQFCTQNIVITQITQGKQGQVSAKPMPPLWWRTCSLWHENQWYLHSVVTPCVLFPFEPLFSLNLFCIQTSMCILFVHTVFAAQMFVWLGVHVLLSKCTTVVNALYMTLLTFLPPDTGIFLNLYIYSIVYSMPLLSDKILILVEIVFI